MSDVNYYKVLGINETANTAEIKQAFRKLVRKYHPDVSHADDADEMITHINIAYEVLSDPEQKKEYDSSLKKGFAHFFKEKTKNTHNHFQHDNSTNSKPGFYWEELKDKFGENSPFGSSSFKFDDLFPHKKNDESDGEATSFQSNNQNQSTHTDYDDLFKTRHATQNMSGEDQYIDINVELESVLTGDTYKMKLSVPTRQINGSVAHEEKTITFQVPKGITHGTYIRLSEQGSASLNGGKNGDLYLKINIKPQDNITIDNSDIHQIINISPWEAALGATISITSVTGEFTLQIPPHSQLNDILRLKGKGIPSNIMGDLLITLKIINPEIKTPQQQQAFQLMKDVFSEDEITR